MHRSTASWVLLSAVAVIGALHLGGCTREAKTSQPSNQSGAFFTEVTAAAGFTHSHHKPTLDLQLDNIMPWVCSVGAAAACGDYDKDGWVDLYVTNSSKGTPNLLYHNNGDGTFTDVAQAAGVGDLNGNDGTSMDCVWGDYDNDGWIDLYVVRWGRDVLLRNRGDGTFEDVTDEVFRTRAGTPGTDWANGNGAVWLDYNRDGRLDLYVGNYFREVDLWHLDNTRIMHNDFERSQNGGENFLFRQEADGTFIELAKDLGIEDPGWTLAVGSADVDNDGWTDLYCADDFGPDRIFLNSRDGTFRDATESALGFDTKKGMNVDFGDFNNDGWFDIYVTNITTAEYLQEGNMLWHNNGPDARGDVAFVDVSLESGTYDGGWGWGAKFFDAENDGDLDIVALNGFITSGEGEYWYDLASWTVLGKDPADAANWPPIRDRSFSGNEITRFWQNHGGTFVERAESAGLASERDGRGVVCFDYDNDGDLDVYFANQGQAPNFYRNDGDSNGHWLLVQFETDPSTVTNRDAIGTRVTVVTAGGHQIREREGGNGYSGQSDPRLHYGLGEENRIALLEVRWPDGGLQYLEDIQADQIVTIKQDPAQYVARVEIETVLPVHVARAAREAPRPEPDIDPAELDAMLADLEERLRNVSADHSTGAFYRAQCTRNNRHDRAIRFFERWIAEESHDPYPRIELALACVDKIPTCGGLAAIVSKGTLARKSIDQLSQVIDEHGDTWATRYCRGMNHLYWPRALRHSDDAVEDLSRCIEMQANHGSEPPPHFLRPYVALGDAYTKASRYDAAREVWRRGLELFPGTPELLERLQIDADDVLLDYVERYRNLEEPIDTDLSFLEKNF